MPLLIDVRSGTGSALVQTSRAHSKLEWRISSASSHRDPFNFPCTHAHRIVCWTSGAVPMMHVGLIACQGKSDKSAEELTGKRQKIAWLEWICPKRQGGAARGSGGFLRLGADDRLPGSNGCLLLLCLPCSRFLYLADGDSAGHEGRGTGEAGDGGTGQNRRRRRLSPTRARPRSGKRAGSARELPVRLPQPGF